MLRFARQIVLRGVNAAGGFARIASSGWRRRRLMVFCYHGFALVDEHQWNPELYLTGEHFGRRLRLLAEGGYQVLRLDDALVRLYEGSLPPRAVVLTVDDGFFDFLAVAYPMLVRAGVPATVYCSTYHVFDQRPIFDVSVDYLLWKRPAGGRAEVPLPRSRGSILIAPETPGGALAGDLRAQARREGWTAEEKHQLLERIARGLGLDWEGFLDRRLLALMTPEEIGGLDPGIADVQLHTHRHRMPEQPDLFEREIEENREGLVRCGRPPELLRHFCYPSGEYLPRHLPWLRERGVISATTCEAGLATPRTDPLQLPRFIDTYLTRDLEFEAWAAGIRGVLHRPGWLRRGSPGGGGNRHA